MSHNALGEGVVRLQRIGLMGGSFNPIHCGHLNLGRACLSGGYAESVLFLPSGNPPHKRQGLADKRDRLRMVELALSGEAGMDVCREEIEREGVIYTVDTLRILREKMPGCAFLYMIGADSLRQLHTWKQPENIIRQCTLLVAMRPGEDRESTMETARRWRLRGAEIELMDAPLMDVSSTGIRDRIAHGQSLDGLVPGCVEAYIREKGLYLTDEEDAR